MQQIEVEDGDEVRVARPNREARLVKRSKKARWAGPRGSAY